MVRAPQIRPLYGYVGDRAWKSPAALLHPKIHSNQGPLGGSVSQSCQRTVWLNVSMMACNVEERSDMIEMTNNKLKIGLKPVPRNATLPWNPLLE